jgi:hypothetical protein
MRMQDRLDDVLQPRTLAHHLIAAVDLPPEGLRRFIWDQNFWQKAAGVELRQHAGVNRVCLDFGVRDLTHLDGIGDHDPLDIRANYARHRRRIAGPFDDDEIFRDKVAANAVSKLRRMVTRPNRRNLPSSQATASASPVYVISNNTHAVPLALSTKWELAGDTTSTDPRAQRIRESREWRPCNERRNSGQQTRRRLFGIRTSTELDLTNFLTCPLVLCNLTTEAKVGGLWCLQDR